MKPLPAEARTARSSDAARIDAGIGDLPSIKRAKACALVCGGCRHTRPPVSALCARVHLPPHFKGPMTVAGRLPPLLIRHYIGRHDVLRGNRAGILLSVLGCGGPRFAPVIRLVGRLRRASKCDLSFVRLLQSRCADRTSSWDCTAFAECERMRPSRLALRSPVQHRSLAMPAAQTRESSRAVHHSTGHGRIR